MFSLSIGEKSSWPPLWYWPPEDAVYNVLTFMELVALSFLYSSMVVAEFPGAL